MDSTTTEDIDIDDFDENFINDEEEEEEEEAPLPPNPYLDYEAFYPPNTNADEYGVSESVSYSAALEAEDVPYSDEEEEEEEEAPPHHEVRRKLEEDSSSSDSSDSSSDSEDEDDEVSVFYKSYLVKWRPYVSGFFRLFPPKSVCFRDSDCYGNLLRHDLHFIDSIFRCA